MSYQFMIGDEICPVREELLGELYSASKLGMPVLVATVPPDKGRCWHCSAIATATFTSLNWPLQPAAMKAT
jgi:hypothetical protein